MSPSLPHLLPTGLPAECFQVRPPLLQLVFTPSVVSLWTSLAFLHCCSSRNAVASCRAGESLPFSCCTRADAFSSRRCWKACRAVAFTGVCSLLVGVGRVQTGLSVTWMTLSFAPERSAVNKAWSVLYPCTCYISAACTAAVLPTPVGGRMRMSSIVLGESPMPMTVKVGCLLFMVV
jgi:hypothetical protein